MKKHTAQFKRRRRQQGRVRRLLGALVLALDLMLGLAPGLSAPQEAQAADSRIVYSSSGRAMFELVLYAPGEAPEAAGGATTGTRAVSSSDVQGAAAAAGLWADLLGPYSANTEPVRIDVTGLDIYNAGADCYGKIQDGLRLSLPLRQIAFGESSADAAGFIVIGTGISSSSLWTQADHLSPVPETDDPDLAAVIFHELGHLAGMGSSVLSTLEQIAGEIGAHAFGGSGGLTEWDTHLYDMFGTKAALGMQPVLYELGGTYDSTVFVSGIGSTSGVTFRGDHVSEVLQGALGGGLPVNGFETGGGVSYAEFCHIELARSLMSHQNWRNWTFFMEAELAVLQDLGYQIDRKNWYGHSVYGDGLEITNTNGFWARNADGTAYVEGEANTATLGVGLHIYGSNNTVTQAADLMACGLAGTGIRVDGTGNTVTVAGGTTVAADGAWGTGLLVSYGQNQTVVSQGTLRAAGEGGIAARFDFGRNLMGEKSEYRGSWMRGGWNAESGSWQQVLLTDNDGLDSNDLPHWLDGAMVSRFAVSGSLEGSAAAVYISDNAYVKQMDILSGASLRGDIVSNWDPQSDRLQYAELTGESNTDLTTLVTFGRETLASGLGGEAGDAAFSLVYDGNITGAKSLELEVAGGGLEYNGKASVLSVTIEEGASLSGTGSYTLSTISDEDGANETGGTFANYGTFSPGSGPAAGDGSAAIAAVSIDGDYEQGANGTLVLSFDSSAASDTLTVSGTASLDGTVALAPVRDYYAGGEIGLVLSDMVDAATLELASDLDSILAAASPTLSMALTVESTGSDAEYSIGISRSADAYSRHAASGQQTDLARNLDEIGQADLSTASGDLSDARNLLTALDFSASDGSALPGAYNELGPDAYTKAGQASLALQRSLTAQIVNGRLFAPASDLKAQAGQSGQLAQAMAAGDESASAASAEAGSTRVFATPMGGRNVTFSSGGSDTSYYGLLAGAETDVALGRDSLTLGVHAAFLHTEGSANDNDTTRGDSIALGLHERYDPALSLDAGSLGTVSPYVMGLVRAGLETRHMEREVSFNGYHRKAESDWTAPTFSAMLGTGLDVRPCDSFVFGPVLWLDWTAMWRPSVEEDGGRAADLDLEAATYQSLRSSLGARMAVRLHDGPDAARLAGSLDLSLTAVWNHEYLYDNGATTARFAHFGSTSFTDRADVSDRDTFGGMLQLTGHLTDNVTLSLFGGLEQGPRTSDARGGASLVWSF